MRITVSHSPKQAKRPDGGRSDLFAWPVTRRPRLSFGELCVNGGEAPPDG